MRKVALLGAVLLLSIALALGGLYWMIGATLTGVQAEVQNIQHPVQSQSVPASGKVSSLADEADTAERAVAINALSGTEVNWPSALGLVGHLLTPSIQLASYSYAVAPAGITLQCAGKAASTVSFAAFIQSLQGNAVIKMLSVSSYAYEPATASVGFSIALTVDPKAITYAGVSSKPLHP